MPPTPQWLHEILVTNRQAGLEAQTTFRRKLASLYYSADMDAVIDENEQTRILQDIGRKTKAIGHLPFPDWLDKLKGKIRERKRNRFLFLAAALYTSRNGTLSELSIRLGKHRQTVPNMAAPNMGSPMTLEMAIKIEVLAGATVLPARFTRTDAYAV